MKIKDVMSECVVKIHEKETTKTAVEIMGKNNIHHLVVDDCGEQMVGVISMQDIRLIENIGSQDKGGDVKWEPFVIEDVEVRQLMSSPVISLDSESSIKAAAEIMLVSYSQYAVFSNIA